MLMRKNWVRRDLGTLVLAAATLAGGCTQARSSARPDASGVQDASADTVVPPSPDCGKMCVSDLGPSPADLTPPADFAALAQDLGEDQDLGPNAPDAPVRPDAGEEAPTVPNSDTSDSGPCPSSALTLCDDGNDCTIDRVDEHCACVHDTIFDGTACDDGDICTESDQCISGGCVGRPYASAPAILGTVTSLSDTPGLASQVAFASENRAVFATSNHLTLVGLDRDRLTILDRRDSAIFVKVGQISPQIWVQRPRFFLIPIGSSRIAVIGNQLGIDLYDLSSDNFVPLGRYGFSLADYVNGAAGRADRVWVCDGTSIQTYAIDGSGNLTRGQIFTLPTNHSCQGMTLSPDGNTLLVATWDGLDFVDVSSSDGTMALSGGVLSGHFLLDVSANTQYVAAYELQDKITGLGNVLVLPTDGDSPIATFSMASGGTTTPVGFTMIDAGLVLQRAATEAWAPLVGEFYGLSPTGATLVQSWTFRTVVPAGLSIGAPFHVVGAGSHVALEPFHQIVRIADSGQFVPVTGPAQGSFERVRAAGTSSVEAHGPMSMALVDIADQASPVLKDGGLVLPPGEQSLQLELSPSGGPSPMLLPIPTSAGNPSGAALSLLWSRQDQLPTPAGSISNDGTSGSWIAAGNYLVQLMPEGNSDFRIRRFPASSMTQEEDQNLVPELDQVLSTTVAADADTRIATWFDMDPRTGRIAILEERRSQGIDAAPSNFTYLNVFSLQGHEYHLSFAGPTSMDQPVGVAVANDLTLLATAQNLGGLGQRSTFLMVAMLGPQPWVVQDRRGVEDVDI